MYKTQFGVSTPHLIKVLEDNNFKFIETVSDVTIVYNTTRETKTVDKSLIITALEQHSDIYNKYLALKNELELKPRLNINDNSSLHLCNALLFKLIYFNSVRYLVKAFNPAKATIMHYTAENYNIFKSHENDVPQSS